MPALLLRWRDHPFLQNEAAIEATLTRGDHAVRTLRALVKRHALDPRQGPGLALSAIDFCLHLTVDWQSLGGRLPHLHPPAPVPPTPRHPPNPPNFPAPPPR